jgi:hypothetical protein
VQSGHYIARQLLSPDDVDDRAVLEEGAYFELYALAIYSWMMYVSSVSESFFTYHFPQRIDAHSGPG